MATPDIDFIEFGIEMLPPNKRIPNWMAWIYGCISQLYRLNNIFYRFINGTPAQYWNSSTTYPYDRDIIYDYKVYRSLVVGNINNQPDISQTQWQLVQNSFIGMKERGHYSYPRLTLEWVLNRYFKRFLTLNGYVGFVQPDSPTTPTHSSIYITNVTPLNATFLVAPTEIGCDSVSTNVSTGFVTNTEIFNTISTCQFNINIPSSVFTAIYPSSSIIAESIIRKIMDKYVIAGVYYNIVTY